MELRKLTWLLLTLCSLKSSGADLQHPEFLALLSKAPSGYTDPSGSNTLFAWWVSSDHATNTAIYDSSPWVDRIQGILLRTPSSVDVTNQAQGVYFITASGGLTNVPLTLPTSNHTICIIFRPNTMGGVTCLYGPYDLSDATQSGATKGGVSIGAGPTLRWGTAFTGGPAISGNLSTSTTYDLIGIQSGTSLIFQTNGVESASLTKTPPVTGWPWRYVGHDQLSAANHFDGWCKEILVWSNSFSSTQSSNVHFYATNLYGGSP